MQKKITNVDVLLARILSVRDISILGELASEFTLQVIIVVVDAQDLHRVRAISKTAWWANYVVCCTMGCSFFHLVSMLELVRKDTLYLDQIDTSIINCKLLGVTWHTEVTLLSAWQGPCKLVYLKRCS